VTSAADDAGLVTPAGRAAIDEVSSHRLGRRLALASLFEAEFGQRTAGSIRTKPRPISLAGWFRASSRSASESTP
jgi:hypothetical protein